MPYDPDQDLRDWDREIVEDRERDARQAPFFAPRSDDCEQYFAVDDARCVECSSRTARACAERGNIIIPEAYPRCAYADECMVCAADCHRRKAIFERFGATTRGSVACTTTETKDPLPPTPDLPEPLPFAEPPLPPEGRRPTAEEAAA